MAHICMQRSLPLHTIKEMQIKNTRRQLFCNQQMHNSQRQYKVLMRMGSKNNFFEEQFGNTQSNQRHVYVTLFPSTSSSRFVCLCSVAKMCWTLCDPLGCSQPGSSVRGISQARKLEWGAISFHRGSSGPRDRAHSSCPISCTAGKFFNH